MFRSRIHPFQPSDPTKLAAGYPDQHASFSRRRQAEVEQRWRCGTDALTCRFLHVAKSKKATIAWNLAWATAATILGKNGAAESNRNSDPVLTKDVLYP